MVSIFATRPFQAKMTNRTGTLILGWIGVANFINLTIVSALFFSPIYQHEKSLVIGSAGK